MAEKVCEAFKWIGQPFTSCDGCGHPFWEHTHQQTVRAGRWFNRVIPPDLKAAVKAKWAPTGDGENIHER